MNNPTEEAIDHQVILEQWGYDLVRTRNDLLIAGSPARSARRAALECQSGLCLVLEAISANHRPRREFQCEALHFLSQAQVSFIHPWEKTLKGTWGTVYDGLFWLVRPFVPGVQLPRETYGADSWRGELAARFLTEMARVSQLPEMPGHDSQQAFFLNRYIRALLPHIRQRCPALEKDLQPILDKLHDFLEIEESLGLSFAHGDFHPGNIIWGEPQTINSVIDWEFCGWKNACYDAANLLGCLGMDEPALLTGPMAMAFIDGMRPLILQNENTWHFLPETIAALRFAWLREWVFRSDTDLIRQELDFIWLILDNLELLRNKYCLF